MSSRSGNANERADEVVRQGSNRKISSTESVVIGLTANRMVNLIGVITTIFQEIGAFVQPTTVTKACKVVAERHRQRLSRKGYSTHQLLPQETVHELLCECLAFWERGTETAIKSVIDTLAFLKSSD